MRLDTNSLASLRSLGDDGWVEARPGIERELLLWPPGRGAAGAAIERWREQVRRQRAVGWADLRGSGPEVARWADSTGVPHLTREAAERWFSGDPGRGGQRSVGRARVVDAKVDDWAGRDGKAPSTLKIVASEHWVVTVFDTRGRGEQEVALVNEVLRGVEWSEPVPVGGGGELATRILLVVARQQETQTRALAGDLLTYDPGSQDWGHARDALGLLQEALLDLRRGEQQVRSWFPAASSDISDSLAAVIEDGLGRLERTDELAVRKEAEHAQALASARSHSLQLSISAVAAVLLGPSFVAAVFDAFPGWQPLERKAEVFIGLSLVAGGLLWVLAYCLPSLLFRARTWFAWAALVIGGAAVGGGLALALPLRLGLDETPPEINVKCPGVVAQGQASAVARVTASDSDSSLQRDPSGLHRLRTGRQGPVTRVWIAEDMYGRRSSASCLYVVLPRRGVK